jgi:hypothetical protein
MFLLFVVNVWMSFSALSLDWNLIQTFLPFLPLSFVLNLNQQLCWVVSNVVSGDFSMLHDTANEEFRWICVEMYWFRYF